MTDLIIQPLYNLLIRLLLSGGLFLTLASCHPQATWVEYQSESYGLQFQYPEDWLLETLDNNVSVKRPQESDTENHDWYEVVFFSELPDEDFDGTSTQVLENLIDGWSKSAEWEGVLSEDPIQRFTLDNYDAAVVRILKEFERKSDIAPSAYFEVNIIVIQDGNRQSIVYTYTTDWDLDDRRLNPLLRKVVQSFRFR